MKLAVEDIHIGERIRKHVDDDIRPLVQSIQELGQLQPVLVDSNNNLICGARRVRACQLLERDVWAERFDGLDDLLRMVRAEQDENTCHKPFTPSELVAMGAKLEAIEKPKAAERKKATQAKPGEGKTGERNLHPPKDKGKTSAKVAKALGVGERTYDKAKAVVAAASKPDAPDEVVEAAEEMDRTGKIDPAFKKVTAALAPVAELPSTPEIESIINEPESPLADLEQLRSETGRVEDLAITRFAKWILLQDDIQLIHDGCRLWVSE